MLAAVGPCFCLCMEQVCEGSGLHPVGEVLLVPDLSAAVDASWLPETVMAPVDMMEKDLCECIA